MKGELQGLGPTPPWRRKHFDMLTPVRAFGLTRTWGAFAIVPTRSDLSLLLRSGDEILIEPVYQEMGPVILNYSVLWREKRLTLFPPSLTIKEKPYGILEASRPRPGRKGTAA